VNVIEALHDQQLFRPAFADANDSLRSWHAWEVILRAAFCLPLSKSERRLFERLTGGRRQPTKAVRELFVVAGRRSGKSRACALIACYLGLFFDHRAAAGEVPTVLVLAQNTKAARIVFSYCRGLLAASAMTEALIESETRDEIRLKSGVEIQIVPANYKGVRGRSVLACICDETSFWWSDELSSNPAIEVLAAVKPALISIPNSLLCVVSSPYSRQGPMWVAYQSSFGKDDNHTLVIQAASLDLNPQLDEGFIAREIERDPSRGQAEWRGLFRADVESFLGAETVDSAVDHDRPVELPPRPGIAYRAHLDASGGRHDAYCLGIAHVEGQEVVLDLCRGIKPPLDPARVTAEFAVVIKRYGISHCTGDRYAPSWVESELRSNGVSFEICSKTTSEVFLECLALFSTGAVRLPNVPALLKELKALERRRGRSGRDSVSHPPSGHDDFAVAACGVLWACAGHPVELTSDMFWSDGDSLSAQLADLEASGVSASEARMMVSRPVAPWERMH